MRPGILTRLDDSENAGGGNFKPREKAFNESGQPAIYSKEGIPMGPLPRSADAAVPTIEVPVVGDTPSYTSIYLSIFLAIYLSTFLCIYLSIFQYL